MSLTLIFLYLHHTQITILAKPFLSSFCHSPFYPPCNSNSSTLFLSFHPYSFPLLLNLFFLCKHLRHPKLICITSHWPQSFSSMSNFFSISKQPCHPQTYSHPLLLTVVHLVIPLPSCPLFKTSTSSSIRHNPLPLTLISRSPPNNIINLNFTASPLPPHPLSSNF